MMLAAILQCITECHLSTAIRSVPLCSRADAAVPTMQQLTLLLASALAPSVGALQHCDPNMHVQGILISVCRFCAVPLFRSLRENQLAAERKEAEEEEDDSEEEHFESLL